MVPEQVAVSLRIHLLGTLRVQDARGPRPLTGSKSQSLLAYLVLHPRVPHRRETLADLLAPDAPPDRVRRNLSDTLYRLQKALGRRWLNIEADTIALQVDDGLWVDVWEFDRLAPSQHDADLQKAVDLYAGDLLPEIYDDWILAEREFRRSQYLSALETLSAHYEAQGKLQQALLYSRRLILTEPLHEPAHQSYLRLLGRLRRFGEALAHYEYLRTLVRSELNSEPMAETRAIIQSLERERDLENAPVVVEETRSFIGRKTERAAALTVVETMLNGNGGLLTVEGEAGIGKSRLLREIAAGARWRGATVLQGQASETPSASPFLPLVEALAPLINSPRGKQLETLLASETLATLAPLNPAWSAKAPSYDIPPEQAGKRFYNALNLFGETLAQLTPVVLVLDDLHWATPVLWECLRSFALGFARHGGLLILAYRRPEIEKLPGWETIQAWDRDGLLKTISLELLSVEEITQFVGETTNVDPAEIRAWTGGNPFFINEWLAEPNLKRPTNRSAISLRLQSLSPTAILALESASILGESIPYRLWTEISELSPLALASLSDELMAHHWLQPSTAGYAFAHDLIRSAVYAEIEPIRRRALHERAANAYLTFEPDNLRSRAFHFDQAGLVVDAAKTYRLAGEQDLARFAFREAQNALDRALALMPLTPTVERIETALTLAQVSNATGDRVRQESALGEALAGAKDSDPHLLQALLIAGRFATQTGQIVEAERQLEAALALARRLHDHTRETEALLLLAELAREQSHWSKAERYYTRALELARAISDSLHETQALTGLGYVADDQGAPHESISWIEQALTIYRTIGDRWRMASTQAGLMKTLINLGAWDHVLAIANESIAVLEACGDRTRAAVARHNQAMAYQALGDYANARQILEHNLQVFEAIRSRRKLGVTQDVLGNVAEGEGNDEEALYLYRSALANAEAVNSQEGLALAQQYLGGLLVRLEQPLEAIPLLEAACPAWIEQGNLLMRVKSEAFLGLALLATGNQARAEQLAASGRATFQSGIPVGEQPQDWLWALYQLLIKLEQSDSAQVILHATYADLQRQAQNIGDPDLRRSFFERVPLNRTIVAAHDRLTASARVVSVSLARRDVPLGRALRPDDYVVVQWTMNAPEDEAIADKAALRHHRLRRLLQEAEIQGAAPTDDDLARALGVSRRTILRDMHGLAQEKKKPTTRKRKT